MKGVGAQCGTGYITVTGYVIPMHWRVDGPITIVQIPYALNTTTS